MNDSQPPQSPVSPRQRMQELLAIPDRNRTDAEWDELNELEIALASGNRPGAPDPQQRRSMGVMTSGQQPKMGGGRPQGKNQGGGGSGGGGKKFHKRPGKRRGGGGGGGGNGNAGGGGPQQPPQ